MVSALSEENEVVQEIGNTTTVTADNKNVLERKGGGVDNLVDQKTCDSQLMINSCAVHLSSAGRNTTDDITFDSDSKQTQTSGCEISDNVINTSSEFEDRVKTSSELTFLDYKHPRIVRSESGSLSSDDLVSSDKQHKSDGSVGFDNVKRTSFIHNIGSSLNLTAFENCSDRQQKIHGSVSDNVKNRVGLLETEFESSTNTSHEIPAEKTENFIRSSNAINDKSEGDELGLCIDMMASRIRELELERERIKLDVIVALRKQFENVKSGEMTNLREIGFDDGVCNIAIGEVEKYRNVELEKQAIMKADYERKMRDLTTQLGFVEKEKIQLSVELDASKKASDSRFNEKQGKLDRVQSRVSYLESLLKTVEKDNTKLKQSVDNAETQLSKYQVEVKSLQNQLDETQQQLEVTKSTDSKMKDFYEREREKMSNKHKSAKDKLVDTENQLAYSKQENEKLLNSKETDLSIIKHLEDKLKRQGALLDTMATDSNKYFELNMKLENKAAEYKQKLKKSAYGIERTHEENKRLKKERESLETDKAQLQRALNEAKRRENNLLFQIKKLEAESEQKTRELDILKNRYNGRFTAATPTTPNGVSTATLKRNDASYAVLDNRHPMNHTWNDESLGPVITSSVYTEHTRASDRPRVAAKLNLSPSTKSSSLKKMFLMESGNRASNRSYDNAIEATTIDELCDTENQDFLSLSRKRNDLDVENRVAVSPGLRKSLTYENELLRSRIGDLNRSPYTKHTATLKSSPFNQLFTGNLEESRTTKSHMNISPPPTKLFSVDTTESGFEGSPVNGHTSPNKNWLLPNGDLRDSGVTFSRKRNSLSASRDLTTNQRNGKYLGEETKYV